MQIPIFLALGVIAWKLSPTNMNLLSESSTYGIYALLVGLYTYQVYHITKINGWVFRREAAEIDHYNFKQVAILDLAYMVTFGSELAVVSMLPLFYTDTFDLSFILAGLLASGFAFTNLVARPGGGLLSDRYGRKKTLMALLAGMVVAYMALSQVTPAFQLPLVVAITMICSFLGQAGIWGCLCNGAIDQTKNDRADRRHGRCLRQCRRRGLFDCLVICCPKIFFLTIAGAAVITLVAVYVLLDEPSGQMVEVLPDGTVEMIDVS